MLAFLNQNKPSKKMSSDPNFTEDDVDMESKEEETQDTYPYYVDDGDIESIDDEGDASKEFKSLNLEYPVLPDVKNLHEAARLCVNDYNSEEGTNLAFVKIIQAERFVACGGYIFLLTITVQDDEGEQSIIKKMVWQGGLLEVMSTEEKTITPEQKYGSVDLKEGFKLGCAATMSHCGYGSRSRRTLRGLHVEHVIEFGKIVHPTLRSVRIKKGEGYIDFSIYNVSVVVTDHDHNKNELIIEGVLRRSKWILPFNKERTKSILTWQKTVQDLDEPPLVCSFTNSTIFRSDLPFKPDSVSYLHDLDLTSPQIMTQAWFAVENYNFNENTNLKFVKVERAAIELGIWVFLQTFHYCDGWSIS